MRFKIFTLLILTLAFTSAEAQESSNNRLALEYYRSGEFAKAADLYSALYKETGSGIHFDYLIACLTELKDYQQASKLLRQQIKRNPSMLEYYVDLGRLYEKSGDKDKAADQYAEAIKQSGESTHQVTRLGEKFMQAQLYDNAIACYLKGQKQFRGQYGFRTELGEAYFRMHNYPKMIAEYMAMLDESSDYVETVQARLQQLIYKDIDNSLSDVLRSELLLQIQRSPNKSVYQEMLIWLFVQQKEFAQAYTQAAALDRRLREDGTRIMDLGEQALLSIDLPAAKNCFSYVADKGTATPYYNLAREKLLRSDYLALQAAPDSAQPQLSADLIRKYRTALSELGIGRGSLAIVTDYAQVLTDCARDPQAAIGLLDSAITVAGIDASARTGLEMQLAASYLSSGDIWESNLIYARIERFNANSPVGHEAKFMRAKIAYYSCDFKYAEAQLDILKASTSKLISNDAFELALLINENTALDTSEAAMAIFARADFLLYQHQDAKALQLLDSIAIQFPGHSLADDVLFRKGELCERKQQYALASEYYQKIIAYHGTDILADNALYRNALLLEEKLGKYQDAMDLYRRLIADFPSSIFVPDARERYRKLRGDAIN